MDKIAILAAEIKGLEDAARCAAWVFRDQEDTMEEAAKRIKAALAFKLQELIAALPFQTKNDQG